MKEHLGLDWSFAPWMDRVEEIFSIIIPKASALSAIPTRATGPLPDAGHSPPIPADGRRGHHPGPDAHETKDVGCVIRERQQLLRDCGFKYFTTFTGGKPEFRKTIKTQERTP